LKKNPGLKKISCLYVHVPFCVRKCIYCDFFSVPYDESAVRRYVDALCKELALKKRLGGILETTYFGGGTPTLLPADCLIQVFKCIRNNYQFSPGIETTVEANPGTIDDKKIETLLSLGVNRLSVGVQSFRDNELVTLGRIHSSAEALRSIESIKKAALGNFSIDLMYGIPGQTMHSWKESLSMATDLSPTHISAYELTPEENTPLYPLIASSRISIPDEEVVLEMYNHAIDYLASHGYEHYEISNFALPGFGCVHNLNYWNRGEYIGAGAGAHSFVSGIRSRNIKDINGYIDHLNESIIPETELQLLSRAEALREFIFLGLRKIEGISVEKTEKEGLDILAAGEQMISENYLEIRDGMLRLTRKGIVVSNSVITDLLEKAGL
jgi:oxygen-independent coproporphyrinogen-3 oxidase